MSQDEGFLFCGARRSCEGRFTGQSTETGAAEKSRKDRKTGKVEKIEKAGKPASYEDREEES